MSIIDQCEQWFKNEGYRCTRLLPTLLSIKYEGMNILIPDNGNDTSFFKMDARFSLDQFDGTSRLKLLETSAKINDKLKVVKVFPDDDDLVFATEILLDESPDIEDVLPRLLSIISQAPKEFVKRLR